MAFMCDSEVQSDMIHESSQKLFNAYEEVFIKNSARRFDEEIWQSILEGLQSGHEIRLTKQIRFLSVLFDVYAQDDEKLLRLITDILSVLRSKYQHVFNPTLDSLITLFTNCTRHDTLTPSHQLFVKSVFRYIDQILSNQSSRKAFDVVSSKVITPWAKIRSSLDDCSDLDEIVSRYLFSANLISQLRSYHCHHGADESAAAKKARVQSYCLKLFTNLDSTPEIIPVLFENYLQSCQKHPDHDEMSESDRCSADVNIALTYLDLIVNSTSSDQQLILFHSMFIIIERHRLYHPNRDMHNVQRSKFVSYLDTILIGSNPELVFNAVTTLLQIDHLFIEDRLVSIWQLIGNHHESDSARSLAASIITAYADLRQISVALMSFLKSSINLRLSSFVPATLFQRIPTLQLPSIIEQVLPELESSNNSVALADVLVLILDSMRDQIPDNYGQIVSALNNCIHLSVDERISIYTAARRARSRRNLAAFLPDHVTGLHFDFLSDLDHVDDDLLLSYEELTPGLFTAVVHCLDEIQSRSLRSVYDFGTGLVRHVSKRITSENWHLVSVHVELLLNFAEPEPIDVIADFIVRDHLELLLLQPSLLENHQLRCVLVQHLTSRICDQPSLADALSQLPVDYLNDQVLEPLASVVFANIGPDHEIWARVAWLKHWPLLKLQSDVLFRWIYSTSSLSAAKPLLKLVLSKRLLELAPSAAQFVIQESPELRYDLLCVVIEAINDHLHHVNRNCSESFYRPIDQISDEKPAFVINDEFVNAISIIADHLPQECHDEPALNLISLLLQFQALSSSEFCKSRSVVLTSVMDRMPSLINCIQDTSPSDSNRMFMLSVASALRLLDNPQLYLHALCQWLINDPCPEICSAFCEASRPCDLDVMIAFLRPHLPSSKNAVLVLSYLMSSIRYRTGHCRVIEKYSTILLIGCGSAIANGNDDAIDALFALVNHLPSVKLSVHQAALIISSLHPAIDRLQHSDRLPSLSRLMFALVRYRHESILSSLPVFCELLIYLLRAAIQSHLSNAILLDNISRVFVELSRLQAVIALSPRLITEYFRAMASKPILDVEQRQAAIQGVMALFDIADREQIQAAYEVLDSPSQALFQTCHKDFLRAYKYYGRS